MKVTIEITNAQHEELKNLMDHMRGEDVTLETALGKCVDQGITQLTYRYKRNEKQWQIAKAQKSELIRLREIVRAREIEDNDIVARD